MGCKLPHVIRARHKRTDAVEIDTESTSTTPAMQPVVSSNEEFISLTFDESSEEDEESGEEDNVEGNDSDSNVSKDETEYTDIATDF